eukprot:4272282-Amphidinium_carterae.1
MDCQQVLLMHAVLVSVNIAKVESKHSSVRRHNVLRSVQTHALDVTSLSALFFLQQLRRGRLAAQQYKSGASALRCRRRAGNPRKVMGSKSLGWGSVWECPENARQHT